ncbi:hypothetical protein HY487_01315 [Candidatus Woesearchaeota archaeon]|nr:hypothetical protein [Candidatus Woesearchaeota archaeon]
MLVFAWSTAYYENALKNISIRYDKSLDKLQIATGKAILENEAVQLKETYQKDKEFFEEKYYDLSTENEALIIEKEKLQAELNYEKSEIEGQKARFDKLQQQFQQVQNSLIKANEEISRLIAKNQELCRKLEEKGERC